MGKRRCLSLVLFAALLFAAGAQSAEITPAGITGSGSYSHSALLIIDGTLPAEGYNWQGSQTVWSYSTTARFEIDLGNVYAIQDFLVQVRYDNDWQVDYSLDGSAWTPLVSILRTYGEGGYGLDTMTTISGDAEYVPELDFSRVQARYLAVYPTGGNHNWYSISEFVTYGEPVPLPATVLLLGSGLLGLIRFKRYGRQ